MNPMGDLSLLESPRKNVGTASRSRISQDIARKRKRRIRRKIMILIMSLKNILRRMEEMPMLHLL
jgi:hypothetical protein